MIRLLIHLAALPFCLTELSKNSVDQTPAAMIKDLGEEILINCSHSNTNFDMIQWYKQSAGKSDMALVGYVRLTSLVVEDKFKETHNVSGDGRSLSSLHIPKLSQSEDRAVYFCAASVGQGNEPAYFGSGTRLTVLENDRTAKAPTVKVLPPSSKECRKQKYQHRRKTLVCVATEFYPDHVSVFWQIDGKKVTRGVATDNTALRDGDDYRITSRLRVSANDWYTPDSRFTCIVSFFDGTKTKNYQNSIFGEKEVTMTRGKYLKITNNAKLSYGVFIVKSSVYGAFVVFLVWKLQGKHN